MKNNRISKSLHPGVCKTKPFRFRTIPFEFRDCEKWPQAQLPDADEISKRYPNLSKEEAISRQLEIARRFERLSRGMRAYMSEGSVKAALEEAQCSRDVFYEQLNRCLSPDETTGEGIVGWPGLIWNLRVKGYLRTSEGEGTAGIFKKWITESEYWRTILHKLIHSGGGSTKVPDMKPTVLHVTRTFISLFRRVDKKTGLAAIPCGNYPNKGRTFGRGAIQRYVSNYVDMHPEVAKVWHGEKAAAREHLGSGDKSYNFAVAPFDVLGTDAHTMDAIGIVIIPGPSGPQRVPITRLKIVVNICHCKRVVTGYSACIRPQIESIHVEEAYLMGTIPWKPKILTIKDLTYAPGAGFPCGSVDGVREVNPASIRLDNAAQHFSKGIRTRLRQSLGCAVLWGGVGHWWRNAVVERLFGALEAAGFQRLPSSMGSGHADPHRSENPVQEAIGRGIEWDDLLQLLDVLLANYNAKPHTALGGQSPLDSLRAAMTGRHACWIPRIRPPHSANTPRVGVVIQHHTINGYPKERIRPFVEIGEIRYSAPCLSTRYDWIGRGIYVHIPRDMRTVEIWFDTGEYVGEIRCLDRGWNETPHSMQWRQAINALIRSGELYVPLGGDPVSAFLNYLGQKVVGASPKKTAPKISADASTAADLLRTTGLDFAPPSIEKQPPSTPHFSANGLLGISLPKAWSD